MTKEYLDHILKLTDAHLEICEELLFFTDDEEKEIRMIEVSYIYPDSFGDEIDCYPIGFGKTEGCPYATIIMGLSPGDFEKIKENQSLLPIEFNWDNVHFIKKPKFFKNLSISIDEYKKLINEATDASSEVSGDAQKEAFKQILASLIKQKETYIINKYYPIQDKNNE